MPLTRSYLPSWSFTRARRVAIYAIVPATAMEMARTTPYLGLPFEPEPRFLDCYPQTACNGATFVETGRTVCLGAR